MEQFDSQNKKLILVVDDEEINRELLGNILHEKYRVEYACDGEEAMQCIRRDRTILSCILLDLSMPKKSGFEVLSEIRTDEMLSHIPVMILTAHQEAEIESLENGAYDFIVKPFETPSLILARVAKTILHAEETYIIRETEKDKLTDLPNLMFFTKLCELERLNLKKTGSKAAYAFFNILNMKAYNTHYSFSEGDKLLYRIGQMLQVCFTDMPVCRLSDDHFAVMGDATELPKILPSFLDKIKTTGRGKAIDFQVGVFIEQDEPVDPSNAIDYARLACNHIRGDLNKHISVFDNSLLQQFEDKQHVLEFFEQALREHWVKVFYQPIVRAITGEISNFEALARWQDPNKGMLNPGIFIPVIEDYKLSAKMDLYMVEEVCREAEDRKAKGIKQVPVSVNFSRNDFDQCNMIEEITKITNKYNYPHEMLVIEITESAFSSNHEYLQEQIDLFHKEGFKVWMDDFGDGFASLNVLQKHNFDLIKLDMGFMRAFNPEGKNGQIITDIIRMAQHLGIHTLCEGIENREQLEFLRDVGCEKIQGFYYGRPMATADFLQDSRTGKLPRIESTENAEFFEDRWGFWFTKDMFNEVPGSILVYKASGNEDILYVSKEILELFECETIKEFLEYTKHSFRNIVHPKDLEKTETAIWNQINSSNKMRDYVKYRIITKKGNVKVVEDLGHLVHHKVYGNIFFVFMYDEKERIPTV